MTAYEMRICDWSSDVCSSDLDAGVDHVRVGDDELADRLGLWLAGFYVGSQLGGVHLGVWRGIGHLREGGRRLSGAVLEQRRRVGDPPAVGEGSFDDGLARLAAQHRKRTRLNYRHYCANRI